MTSFLVKTVQVVSSTLGSLSALNLQTELNRASELLVYFLNAYLPNFKVPIPSDLCGVFYISDLFLQYNDGYMYFGATPIFIAPSPIDDDPPLELVQI